MSFSTTSDISTPFAAVGRAYTRARSPAERDARLAIAAASRAEHRPPDRQRVVGPRRRPPRQRARIVCQAELAKDRALVEVDALTHQTIAVEHEQRRHPTAERA